MSATHDVPRETLLRVMVRRGFTAECRAAGVDPDAALRALTRPAPLTLCRWFPCSRDCGTPLAWSRTGDPEDAVCCACLKNDRLRR